MITRFVRIQLVAFVVVSALCVTYLGIKYIRLGSLVGQGGYTVRLQLASSGGIFSNAEVTYRGVTIGRVGELRLIPDGVEADLHIDHGTPRVPADLKAMVANRSAVGEQYVDLRPNTSAGPYLADRSVITMDRTSTPLPVDTALLKGSALQSFSRDLRLLSEQLVASDPDIRALIAAAPAVSAELSALLRDAGPGLSRLMADVLLLNREVLLTRQDNLRVPLIAYPIVAAGGYSVLAPDGNAHLSLTVDTFDPPPCTNGYQSTVKREGTDAEPLPLDLAVNCAEPLGSPIDVRGVKAGYPYVDGKPSPVPEWVCEKYREAAENFRVDCDGGGDGQGGVQGQGDAGGSGAEAVAGPAALPGLLGAPDGAGAIELVTALAGGAR